MRFRLGVALCLTALAALGCGKDNVTNPNPESAVPWIAIDTTDFDGGINVAISEIIHGTAGNYPDSALVLLWQYVQEVKSEQWSWCWWEMEDGDSTMVLDSQGRWWGEPRVGRFLRDSIMVILTVPESLAAMPRQVQPGQAGEVRRHALAFAQLRR